MSEINISDVLLSEVLNNRKIKETTRTQYKYIMTAILNDNIIKKLRIKDLPLAIHYIIENDRLTFPTKRNWVNLLNIIYKYYMHSDIDQKLIRLANNKLKELNVLSLDSVNAPSENDYHKYLRISDKIKTDIISLMRDRMLYNDDMTDDLFKEKMMNLILLYMYTNIEPRRSDIRSLIFSDNMNYRTAHININSFNENNNKKEYIYYPEFKRGTPIKIHFNEDTPYNWKILLAALKLIKPLYNDNEKIFGKKYSEDDHNSKVRFLRYIIKLFKDYYQYDTNLQKLRRLYALRLHTNLHQLNRVSDLMGHNLHTHTNIYMKKNK